MRWCPRPKVPPLHLGNPTDSGEVGVNVMGAFANRDGGVLAMGVVGRGYAGRPGDDKGKVRH